MVDAAAGSEREQMVSRLKEGLWAWLQGPVINLFLSSTAVQLTGPNLSLGTTWFSSKPVPASTRSCTSLLCKGIDLPMLWSLILSTRAWVCRIYVATC